MTIEGRTYEIIQKILELSCNESFLLSKKVPVRQFSIASVESVEQQEYGADANHPA